MDVFKAQFARMQQQLAALTATQRMLAGSLIAIMALTVIFWSRYASNAEMVPVVDRAFDANQLIDAQHDLKAEGINAQISADRLVVPADQQDHAFALLSFHKRLPNDTVSAFEEVLSKQTNPFDDPKKSDLIFNHAREAQLAQIINTFPGVSNAQVVINNLAERHIGEATQVPSGMVILTTADTADANQLVDSAAYTLVRTVPSMTANHVNVTINGRLHRPHDLDNPNGSGANSDTYDEQEKQERRYQERVETQLENYSRVLVSVSVDINTETSESWSTTYDGKKSVQQLASEDNQTDNTTQANAPAEPGVAPNVGMSVAPTAAPTNNTSSERNKNTYVNGLASTTENRKRPAGAMAVTAASVSLPRSDFLKRYLDANPGAKEPDDEALEKLYAHELNEVRNRVAGTCNLKKDDDRIVVAIYSDMATQVAAVNAAAAATAGMGATITGHAKEIAIGLLALMSLFMVSMIVRKSGPVPSGATLAGVGGGGFATVGSLLDARSAGGDDDGLAVVGGGRPAMEGIELDDASYKAQQMVEQVTTMVTEDPDSAATLVRRWLNK